MEIKKNRSFVELRKNKLFIYFNFKDTCRKFSENIKLDQLLKSAKSQNKYNLKNKRITEK